MIRAAAALLLVVVTAAAPAPPRRLPPVDQCAADPSFAEFRETLNRAIADREVEGLLALLADDVTVDFGGGAGAQDFAAAWGLDHPHSSRLWRVAATALSLGCAKLDGHYAAPSLAWQLEDEDEPFELAVARPGAALLAAPRDDADLLLKLDWHVVTVPDVGGGAMWVAATLSDGRKGYVHRDYLRSPLDYHFAFEKRGGRWLVTAFVAGD